jgi:ABC-type branched-subunit amino acid transport system ATPase component
VNSAPLLQVSGVSKRFPGVVALDSVSLDVRSGEFIGLSSEGAASAAVKVRLSELFSKPRCCRCFEISST